MVFDLEDVMREEEEEEEEEDQEEEEEVDGKVQKTKESSSKKSEATEKQVDEGEEKDDPTHRKTVREVSLSMSDSDSEASEEDEKEKKNSFKRKEKPGASVSLSMSDSESEASDSEEDRTAGSMLLPPLENLEECSSEEVDAVGLPIWSHLVVLERGDRRTWFFPVRDSHGRINKNLLKEARRELTTGRIARKGRRNFFLSSRTQTRFHKLCQIAWPGTPMPLVHQLYLQRHRKDQEEEEEEEGDEMKAGDNPHWLESSRDVREETSAVMRELRETVSEDEEEELRAKEERAKEDVRRLEEEARKQEEERARREAERAKQAKGLLAKLREKRQLALAGPTATSLRSKLLEKTSSNKRSKASNAKKSEATSIRVLSVLPKSDDMQSDSTGQSMVEAKVTKSKAKMNKKKAPMMVGVSARTSFRATLLSQARMEFAEKRAHISGFKNIEHQLRTQVKQQVKQQAKLDKERAMIQSGSEDEMEEANGDGEEGEKQQGGEADAQVSTNGEKTQAEELSTEDSQLGEEQQIKKDRALAYRTLLEKENKLLLKRRQKQGEFVEEEASEEEEDDGLEDYGGHEEARKTRSKSEELERRLDRRLNKLTEEDLEGIVDDISDDEGNDGGDVDEYHRQLMDREDEENLKRLERGVREHKLVQEVARRRKNPNSRHFGALEDGSDEEDTDEEDELAQEERYRAIDEERRAQAVEQSEGEKGETIEDIDAEAEQQAHFLRLSKLERRRRKMLQKKSSLDKDNLLMSSQDTDPIAEKKKDILRCIKRSNSALSQKSGLERSNSLASQRSGSLSRSNSLARSSSISSVGSSSILGKRILPGGKRVPSFKDSVSKEKLCAPRSSSSGEVTTLSRQYVFSVVEDPTPVAAPKANKPSFVKKSQQNNMMSKQASKKKKRRTGGFLRSALSSGF